MLPELCWPPASFVMISEIRQITQIRSLTSGAASGLESQQQRCPLPGGGAGAWRMETPPCPRLNGEKWGQAAGCFPYRLPDSGFGYPLPFQGQHSDLEGRL